MGKERFKVVIQLGEDGMYVAKCPAIPGCFSQGKTIQEAFENIKEAVLVCLQEMKDRGEDLPDSDEPEPAA